MPPVMGAAVMRVLVKWYYILRRSPLASAADARDATHAVHRKHYTGNRQQLDP